MQSGHFSKTMPNLRSNPEPFAGDDHYRPSNDIFEECCCGNSISPSSTSSKQSTLSLSPTAHFAPSGIFLIDEKSRMKDAMNGDVIMTELPTLIEEESPLSSTQNQTSPRNFLSTASFQRSMKVTAKEFSKISTCAPPPTKYRRSAKDKRNRSCSTSRRVFNAMQGFNISMTLSKQRKDMFKRTTSMP
ncbi:hypothetical protein GUITHDRAFT_152595 [Guillardia theta CCMP2712]|uniref:Uncharacterized protein n=1 Tax=Guillardia theta (strain CCMP2712) TaxID=905079 RepID=L1JCP3_GUITC|nr:hypothetical protein GUITHDRAFT_152595 [Guillardia theta CCMP2712]EKX45889.1 hypothetical protein GUITHDRAFT_152595 [Guillardia theta CCMP2712]|mmetsp:Transcript_42452/g.133725  ORF Transcript_42452/g.133725 Transcript_42452/m.133725 type:complete len:188 (-) Transcript_42452:117-680(-)|eukprot:XP_005832869.1 hypothetical protein GUITHDRAFT_152595 [Guillardia theta CCMP2712]